MASKYLVWLTYVAGNMMLPSGGWQVHEKAYWIQTNQNSWVIFILLHKPVQATETLFIRMLGNILTRLCLKNGL